MIPRRIARATHKLGAPEAWDEARMGKCVTLWVRRASGCFASAWEPTPAELEKLNAGASVVLYVSASGQPPVALAVEEVEAPE